MEKRSQSEHFPGHPWRISQGRNQVPATGRNEPADALDTQARAH
jgi:hypothetical protein